jgi:Ferric reductase NAD binding domain
LAGFKVCYKTLKLRKLIVRDLPVRRQPALNNVVANFLRINIYLTQRIDEDMMWNIAINDAGAEYDPLTLLRTRTMFGRPNWKSIYMKMRLAIEAGQYLPGSTAQLKTTVGTYFCGPGALAKSIKQAADEATSTSVKFTFAKVRIEFLASVVLY